MNSDDTFQYTYSAPETQEVLDIRNKYLPRQESKLDELKRLDGLVQSSGVTESLFLGILGCLVFGVGMCLCMKVLGGGMSLGLLLGSLGVAGMVFAYPVYRKKLDQSKQKYVPRILELSAELTRQSEWMTS